LIAKRVRKLVIDSDKYLKDLLAQGAVPFVPEPNDDLLNSTTENEVKLERLEEDPVNKDQILNYDEICGLFNENDSNTMPESGDQYSSDPQNYQTTEKVKMSHLGDIKKELAEEIEVKVEMMESLLSDPESRKKRGKKLRFKAQEAQVHQCLVCGKVYKNKYILKAHEARHYPQPPSSVKYACDLCGREFTKKVNIYRHMQGVHFKEKKYKCTF
jgi:hypothetical protein